VPQFSFTSLQINPKYFCLIPSEFWILAKYNKKNWLRPIFYSNIMQNNTCANNTGFGNKEQKKLGSAEKLPGMEVA